MTYSTIQFKISNAVGILTLDRPDRLNSFTLQMHSEVRDALDLVNTNDGIRCLLLTGNGRGFCAGQDLADRTKHSDNQPADLSHSLNTQYNPLVRTLTELSKPVICAVNGVAAGAGANLALVCDIVFAARSASFIQSFCKLGLIPDSGGTWSLPNLVGRARAMGIAMLGDRISAEQAEHWGLIWKCVDDDQLMTTAIELAQHLATQPTQGLAAIKHGINMGMNSDLNSQLDYEASTQGILGQTNDYKEGVTAFIKSAKPIFPVTNMTNTEQKLSADELARACADEMLKNDPCSKALGMQLVNVGEGYASMSMTIREDMLNGHGITHGGLIFTLADSCFAFACNSRNQCTVAQNCMVDFIRPSSLGDRLTANAKEINLTGKNGIYDIVVSNQNDQVVAQFRGKSRAIRGTIINN